MQRWRNRAASHLDLYHRVTILASNRCLRATLDTWRRKLRDKRQRDWRNDMRTKMRTIQNTREDKLRKDAWSKWRQLYQSHLSGQHYVVLLIRRSLRQWKRRLVTIDHLEAAADELSVKLEGSAVGRCFIKWQQMARTRGAERTVGDRVALRVMGEVMHVWKKHA